MITSVKRLHAMTPIRASPPNPLSNFTSVRGKGEPDKARLFSPSPRSGEAAELERGLGVRRGTDPALG